MSLINLEPAEVTALWEASLDDWRQCCERLLEKLLAAYRRDPQACPVGVCEDEMVCYLDCSEGHPKILDIGFFDERLAEKKHGYNDLYGRFWHQHYYGSDK